MQSKIEILILLTFCLSLPVQGQHASFVDTSEGLGNPNIRTMAQDTEGLLWAGTENGLYRFDGFRFRLFGPAEGLRGYRILQLFAEPGGGLFVATEEGLFYRRPGARFTSVEPPPRAGFSLSEELFFTISPSKQIVLETNGNLWTLRLQGESHWNFERLLSDAQVHSPHFDAHGVLWFGCGMDLCRRTDGVTYHVGAALRLPAASWRTIVEDHNGNLWLRSQNHVAEILPGEPHARLHDLPDTTSATDLAIGVDNQPVAAQGETLRLWQQGIWQTISPANGLDHATISALFIDRQGVLWIAQTGHGLRRWIGKGIWDSLTTANGLGSNVVTATLRDRSGRLWIATDAGIYRVAPHFSTPHLWKSTPMETLLEAPDGAIWAGNTLGSVVRIDAKSLREKRWQTPSVFRLAASPSGQILAATAAGLYSFPAFANTAPVLAKDSKNEVLRQPFFDLIRSPSGDLWAASNSGLYHLINEHWQHIDPGLNHFPIRRIAFDHAGNLWATGNFPGLLRLRLAASSIQETEHLEVPPLLSNHISALLADHRGRLWIGTDRGLSVFDGVSWHSYTRSNGLPWNDCRGLFEDRDGSLRISTSGGLAHLLRTDPLPPSNHSALALVDASLGDQHFDRRSTLHWMNQPLRFTFAAPDFTRLHPARLHYRLLGRETNWNSTADNVASYAQLPPGEYMLEVSGEDDSGNTDSATLEIPFHLRSAWWQNSFLHWLLLLLAAIAGVWVLPVLSRYQKLRHAMVRMIRRKMRQEKMQRSLQYMCAPTRSLTDYDDLTGLWNQRFLRSRLRNELDRARRSHINVGVLRMDVDGLNRINEQYGWQAGDQALQEISRILLRAVRSYDWVAHCGSGEFLILLSNSRITTAYARANALRLLVESTQFSEAENPFRLTVSCGVSSGAFCSSEQLMESAEIALRRAKKKGYNCVVIQRINSLHVPCEPHEDQISLFFDSVQ